MPLNKLPRLRDPQKRDFVHQVRDLFLEEYKREPDLYYPEDVKQVEGMQFLMQRCIIYKKKNVKDSLNMLKTMLQWRKEHRLREIGEFSFPVEYYLTGTAFLYEPDKYGNRTLYVRTSLLRNIAELKPSFKEWLTNKMASNYSYLASLMYQIDDSVNGKTWSVIFDLTNTGWSNYDIELLMHFLTLLREYFPVNLDYVLAINFPWVLSAGWAIAKRLIPPERRDVVIFISDKEIFNYIDKENVPDFLGGTCTREHKIHPNTNYSTVKFLLSQKDQEISPKRIREIIKAFSDILPENHVNKMFEELASLTSDKSKMIA